MKISLFPYTYLRTIFDNISDKSTFLDPKGDSGIVQYKYNCQIIALTFSICL